ncbi:MAG: nucleoside deaminase [Candidatus Uhrbacteria bacterium]|nr:nucleoside deaminase [Candidatus Uhrbacteria bacterium]
MDNKYLKNAIELSKESAAIGGFPVGALVVLNGEIISKGLSNGKQLKDATSHAETVAIREASKILDRRDLKGATIYSSLEPCLMCFSASYWAGVSRIVYACSKNKVSKQHYEGLHDLHTINSNNNRLIELIQLIELENEALDIIEDWEKSQIKQV